MKQKQLFITGTALALAAALAGCGNTPAADQTAKISMEQAQTAALLPAAQAAACLPKGGTLRLLYAEDAAGQLRVGWQMSEGGAA